MSLASTWEGISVILDGNEEVEITFTVGNEESQDNESTNNDSTPVIVAIVVVVLVVVLAVVIGLVVYFVMKSKKQAEAGNRYLASNDNETPKSRSRKSPAKSPKRAVTLARFDNHEEL